MTTKKLKVLNSSKSEAFVLKDYPESVKTTTDWEKIFGNHVFGQGLIQT
jgi:hypothetical protein